MVMADFLHIGCGFDMKEWSDLTYRVSKTFQFDFLSSSNSINAWFFKTHVSKILFITNC